MIHNEEGSLKSDNKHERPFGITIISVLFILAGVLELAGLITGFILFSSLSTLTSSSPAEKSVSQNVQSIVLNILLTRLPGLIPAILFLILGLGLFKIRKWAWIATLVILSSNFAFSVIHLDLLSFIICLVILAYLLEGEVKDAFSISKRTGSLMQKLPILGFIGGLIILGYLSAFSPGNRITGSNKGNEYYEMQALDHNDLSLCDKINNQSQRDNCYSEMARLRKDPEICSKLSEKESSEYLQDECYKNVALQAMNGTICNKIILNKTAAEYCLSLVDFRYIQEAEIENNSSLCEKMIEVEGDITTTKEHCYGIVAQRDF